MILHVDRKAPLVYLNFRYRVGGICVLLGDREKIEGQVRGLGLGQVVVVE